MPVWNAETGQPIGGAVLGHSALVECVALSAGGTRVVSGSRDETVRVWDVETGEPVGDAMRGHSEVVLNVALSPDGRRVASGSADGTMRVWDVDTGECLQTEDYWTFGDMRQLHSLLREEGAVKGKHEEECRLSFGDECVKYGSADDGSILATLEEGYAMLDYCLQCGNTQK